MNLPPLELTDLPGGRVAFRRCGSGPAILCLHGLGGGSKSWSRQFEDLSSEFTVVAWDAPGYGGSDRRAPRLDAYAEAAVALIEVLGIAPGTLVGHSMGGVVAARLAAIRPGLVTRLELSCTFWGEARAEDAPLVEGYAQRLVDHAHLSVEAFGRARARGMTGPNVDPDIFDEVAGIASEIRGDGFADTCHVLNHADNRAILPALRMPVLVLSAEHDSVVRNDRIEPLAALLPGCVRAIVTGAGHAPYLEDAGQYDRILREFVNTTATPVPGQPIGSSVS